MKLRNAIVYLIGHAGVGKYTVAKEICARAGAKLVDNHLINNPVFSVIQQDGVTPLPESVWMYTRAIRNVVIKAMQALSPPDFSFVFTNDLEETLGDRALYEEIKEVAERRKSAFFPVRLVADAAALRARKASPERRERMKDVNLENIQWRLDNSPVLQVEHPNLLTLDTSGFTAEKTAEAILHHIRGRHAD